MNPNTRLIIMGALVMLLGAKLADAAHSPALFWVGILLASAGFGLAIVGLFRKWRSKRA